MIGTLAEDPGKTLEDPKNNQIFSDMKVTYLAHEIAEIKATGEHYSLWNFIVKFKLRVLWEEGNLHVEDDFVVTNMHGKAFFWPMPLIPEEARPALEIHIMNQIHALFKEQLRTRKRN
ncbi:hypothetical protein LCGC14_1462790 [marine sediment metagenome]|uniref:Uncharacterized protein n=1 Tax=marine sediment metagenome TaxID=412755 RepID=A0A0F9JF47_9ZZZZ